MSNATAPRATLAREQTVNDDPTLNSPFEEPQAHFRFLPRSAAQHNAPKVKRGKG